MDSPSIDRTDVRSIAASYVHRGWSVVPVPYREKGPDLNGWQLLRITESELRRYFPARALNVGVLLGEPSDWLIDVDLDHLRALEIAPRHLPVTEAVFERRSKPRSHWLYRSTQPVATRQWRLPGKQMIVELRSTGGQTVFPGSVHPSGETIEWDVSGEPAEVDPDELQHQLQRMYVEVCQEIGITNNPPSEIASIQSLTAPTRILDRARRYLAKIPAAVSGQGGHDATFHAACTLVVGFGLGREQALALLAEWNLGCQPPWTEKELYHKVDDALKQPGWRGYLLLEPDQVIRTRQSAAIARANRHAIEHRLRARRRARAL